jgi:hypothetical protein
MRSRAVIKNPSGAVAKQKLAAAPIFVENQPQNASS